MAGEVHNRYETSFTTPTDTEIRIERIFDAPVELLWRAHTEPELMKQWWGPAKYRLEVVEMDVRPGGAYRYVCHGAEGEVHTFFGKFQEVRAPSLLILTFGYEGVDSLSVERMELTSLEDGRTRFVGTSTYDSKEDREGMMQGDSMEGGVRESYDRLDILTTSMM